MGQWIDASLEKPKALRAVLAKTDRHKHPIDLLDAIDRAQAPSRHQGALL